MQVCFELFAMVFLAARASVSFPTSLLCLSTLFCFSYFLFYCLLKSAVNLLFSSLMASILFKQFFSSFCNPARKTFSLFFIFLKFRGFNLFSFQSFHFCQFTLIQTIRFQLYLLLHLFNLLYLIFLVLRKFLQISNPSK